MTYDKQLRDFAARRDKIIQMVSAGKPRSVVARIMKISRQRVYQLTADIKRKNGNGA